MAGRRLNLSPWLQRGLILLLVDLLVFPPTLSAASITWIGGVGNYTNTSLWNCSDPGCTSPTYPDNGNLGLNYDVTIDSGSGDRVTLNAAGVTVNSMSIGGSGPSNSSTLFIVGMPFGPPSGAGDITIGTPSVTSGNVLAVSNGGILNINFASPTLELSGGNRVSVPSALIDTGGQVIVNETSTLTIQNTSGGSRTLTNNGNLTVDGASVIGPPQGANLVLNGAGASFTLAGSGTLTLLGSAQITGNTGTESLISGNTIAGSGAITNLANVSNFGTLESYGSGGVNSLVVSSNLTNWTAGTGTLSAGNYVVNDGSILQLSSIGSGMIQSLGSVSGGGANVTINGSGLLTGDGTTNALSQLSNITQSTLTLNNNNFSINPSGTNGTLTLSDGNINVNTGSLEVDGNLLVSGSFGSNGVNVSGGNLKVDGAMTNGGSFGGQAVNLTNNSTATVSGLFTNASGVLPNSVTLDSSTLITNGGFSNQGGQPNPLAVVATVTLQNGSTLTNTGLFSNSLGSVSLSGASTLTTGTFDNTNGTLTLNGGGNTLTAGGFINAGGTLSIGSGDKATFDTSGGGTFNNTSGVINVNDAGTLTLRNTTGGTFTNGGTLNLNGSVNGTSLILDSGGNSTTFDLGTTLGTFNRTGNAFLSGASGAESLVNGTGNSFTWQGGISNFAGFTNNGTLVETGGLAITNVGFTNNSMVTVNKSLTFDTSNGGSFYNAGGATINVNAGDTLTFRNTSGGTAVFANDGAINLNAIGAIASLVLDGGGNATTFDLTSPGGTGTLGMNFSASIHGATGAESLINDSGHTIGDTGFISNLAGFTNNGTLTAHALTLSNVGLTNNGLVTSNFTLTLDTSNGGSFSNTKTGTVNVSSAASLTLLNTSGGTTVIANDGQINLSGAGSQGGALLLNGGGAPTTFDLTSPGGTGTLAMSGNALIIGFNGNESLINDTGHTISGAGTISYLAGFTNNGTIAESGGLSLNGVGFTNNSLVTANNSLTFDTSYENGGGSFDNAKTGIINVNNGTALTFRNIPHAPTAVFTNDGAINLNGTGSPTSLVLDGGGFNSNFSLTSPGGTGTIALNGAGISGATGAEKLINGAGSTISGNGTISNLAGFTNNGTLSATGSLVVSPNLTNWNAGTGTLTGGTYLVGNGSTLQLSSVGGIQTLYNGVVTVGSAGLLTGDGSTSLLSSLTNVTADNSGTGGPALLNLTNQMLNLGGSLNITATDNSTKGAATTASVTLGGGSTLTLAGSLTNSANNNSENSSVSSAFNLTGSTGSIGSNLTNEVTTTGDQGFYATGGSAQVNLTNSSLSVGGNVSNLIANSGFQAAGGTASLNLTNSSLTITGNLSNSVTDNGTAGFLGTASTNLTNGSTLTVGGTLTNATSGINPAAVLSLSGGSSATVSGLFTNGAGGSVTVNGSTLTAQGGFNNTGGSLTLSAGSTGTVGGLFTNGGTVTLNGSTLNNTGLFDNTNSTLALNGSTLTSGGFNNTGGSLSLSNLSTLTNTGAFTNTGTITLNGGGNVLNGGVLTNTNGSLTAGAGDKVDFTNAGANSFANNTAITAANSASPQATLSLTGATFNGINLNNTSTDNSTSAASPIANLNFLSGSTLTLSGSLTNAVNNNSSGSSAAASVNFTGSTGSIGGNLTTEVTTTGQQGFYATGGSAQVNLTNSSLSVGGSVSNLITNSGFQAAGGTASLNLTNSSLTITGNLSNSVTDSGVAGYAGTASTNLTNGSTLTVGGTLTNATSGINPVAQLSLSGGSSATVSGLLTNGAGGAVTVDGSTLTTQGGFNNSGGTVSVTNAGALNNTGLFDNTSGSLTLDGSTLTTGGFTNTSGTLNVANAGALNNTGAFTNNGGTINLSNAATLTTTGLFDNSNGTLTLNATTLSTPNGFTNNGGSLRLSNLSTLNKTGLIDNTNGAITLNGGGNVITGAGFNNTNGTITVGAGDTADFRSNGAGQLTNLTGGVLTGGTYNLSGNLYYDTGTDGSTAITSINGANLNLNGGALLYGPGNGTNPLGGLTSLANSTLTLNNSTVSFTPNGGTFTLDPSTLNLNGTSLSIAGAVDNAPGSTINLSVSGTPSTPSTLSIAGALNNEVGSSVNLNGGGNVLTALGFTNSGSLTVGAGDTADFRTGGKNTFTTLDATGTLNGGAYNISGTFAYDGTTGMGGGQILNLNGANVAVNGGQIVFGGAAGSAGSNALAALTNITATDLPGSGPASLNLTNYTLNLSKDLNNTATTYNDNSGTGSSISLTNATLSAHNLTNSAIDSSPDGAAPNVSVNLNSGTLTLAGNLVNTVNNAASNLGSQATARISLNNSSLAVGGNLSNTVTNGGNFESAQVNLTNSTLTVGGTLTNSTLASNAGSIAQFNLIRNSTVNVTGLVDNTNGQINMYYGGGNVLTGGGFNNTNGMLDVEAGNTADFRTGRTNTFANLDGSTGTLNGGGTFNVGGTLLFDPTNGPAGGNIYVVGGGTTLGLGASGAQILYGPGAGTNAVANLTEVAGTLNFYADANPSFTPNGGIFTIDGTGTMNMSGSGGPTINGSLVNNGNVSVNSNSLMTVTGDLTNNGVFLQQEGAFSSTNIQGNLTNNGAFNVGDGDTNTVNGSFYNAAGATLTLDGSDNGTGLAVNLGIDNAGAIVQSSFGTGATVTAGAPIVNEATGTILVSGGSYISSPGFTNNGSLNIQGSAANFQGGSFTNLSNGTLTGGTYVIGGTFQFDSSSGVINNIAAGTNLTLDGQYGGGYQVLSGNNNALANLTSNAGNFTLTNAAVLNTDTTSTGGTFTNSGTITTTTGFGFNQFNVTGNIFNTSAGVVNLEGPNDQMTATGQFTNAGMVTIGNGDLLSVGGDYVQTAGITTVDAGGELTTGLFDLQGGTLTGGGEINGNLTLDGGTLSPGDPQSIDVTGDYDQTVAGILDLDLASPSSYDQVDVGGSVTLDGTLELTLADGFDAALGTVFDVMNWNGPEPNGPGDFATFIDPIFDNGTLTFEEVFNGNQLDLEVVATGTPEPSTFAMFLCAALMGAGVAWRIRRRRGSRIIDHAG